jgi:hypothetical protein
LCLFGTGRVSAKGGCMPSKIKDLLASLRETSGKINRESDELTSAIKEVEMAIGRLKLGIPVWLTKPIHSSFDAESGTHFDQDLGYAKCDEKSWGLYIQLNIDGEPHGTTRLSEARRDDKLLAIEHLESLIEALLKEAQKKADEISSARKKVKQIVEELGEGSSL